MPVETWTRGEHHDAPPDALYIFGHSDGGVQWLTIAPDPDPPTSLRGAAHQQATRTKHE